MKNELKENDNEFDNEFDYDNEFDNEFDYNNDYDYDNEFDYDNDYEFDYDYDSTESLHGILLSCIVDGLLIWTIRCCGFHGRHWWE